MVHSTAPASERLVSLDAYRGFVMVCLAANGFGLTQTAKNFPDSRFWQVVGFQFEHVPWVGCAFWDLIQPSFMFMVGVALPYSLAKRAATGNDDRALAGHALVRSLALIALGVFLSSNSNAQTNFTFMNVLSQIGLGYFFLYLLGGQPRWVQGLAAAALLAGYWAWFATGPLPPADYDYAAVGVKENVKLLEGFEAHWQMNANVAHRFDLWFLNLFPRPEPFVFNNGGYQTLNFLPSLATMIFGLMTGEFVRRSTQRGRTFLGLLLAGLLLLAAGWGIAEAGWCPLVKRIWTPSWTLFSTGWTLILLSGFYGVIDGLGWKAWSFPLVVAGMNSITLYLISQTLKPFTRDALQKHTAMFWGDLGESGQSFFTGPYRPMLEACAVFAAFWLVLLWLYRQRVFLKI
jgi:heparan-alpha-glucosaminide N-acetyltransferase